MFFPSSYAIKGKRIEIENLYSKKLSIRIFYKKGEKKLKLITKSKISKDCMRRAYKEETISNIISALKKIILFLFFHPAKHDPW